MLDAYTPARPVFTDIQHVLRGLRLTFDRDDSYGIVRRVDGHPGELYSKLFLFELNWRPASKEFC